MQLFTSAEGNGEIYFSERGLRQWHILQGWVETEALFIRGLTFAKNISLFSKFRSLNKRCAYSEQRQSFLPSPGFGFVIYLLFYSFAAFLSHLSFPVGTQATWHWSVGITDPGVMWLFFFLKPTWHWWSSWQGVQKAASREKIYYLRNSLFCKYLLYPWMPYQYGLP